MAKKKQRNPAGTTAVTSSRPVSNPVSGRSARKAKVNTQPSAWITVAGLAIITWLFYNVSLQNQFTNWDDLGYVKDNPLVKDLSGEGLRKIFTAPVMGNYHPFTILSYALE